MVDRKVTANSMQNRGPQKNQGFSLLEILVAFTIMSISLGIVLKIFSSGVNTAVISEDYIIATQIAESLMAKTGIEEPLISGQMTGVDNDKYQWQVNIENTHVSGIEEPDVELMNIQVQVQWDNEQQNGRMIELNSIKTIKTSVKK